MHGETLQTFRCHMMLLYFQISAAKATVVENRGQISDFDHAVKIRGVEEVGVGRNV